MTKRRQFFKAFASQLVAAGDLLAVEVMIAPGATNVRAVVVPPECWKVLAVEIEEHCLGAILAVTTRLECKLNAQLRGGVMFEADPKDAATNPLGFAQVPEKKDP